MKYEEIEEIVRKHKMWLLCEPGGERADFSGMDLRGVQFYNAILNKAYFKNAALNNADFFGSELAEADFTGASLFNANLEKTILRSTCFNKANLSHANLDGAMIMDTSFEEANLSYINFAKMDLSHLNMSGAILRDAILAGADLSVTYLKGAILINASLARANLNNASLNDADLRGSDLSFANLKYAVLSGSNLENANMNGTYLANVDLSDTEGVLSPINFLADNFEKTDEGYIVYKTFGESYSEPKYWELKEGSVISEVPNTQRSEACGCGINVATYSWVRNNYEGDIWRCLIKWEWLCGVVVPYNTDGKIRCERLMLLENMCRLYDE